MQEKNASVAQNDAELKKSVKSGMGLVVFAVVMTVVALGACGFAIYTKATENKRIDDAVSERCLVPASSVEGVPVAGDPSSANITDNTNCISDNTNLGRWYLRTVSSAAEDSLFFCFSNVECLSRDPC